MFLFVFHRALQPLRLLLSQMLLGTRLGEILLPEKL